jgi:hypothetical protein
VPDRHPHGAVDQGVHGDAFLGVIKIIFPGNLQNFARQRAVIRHRDRAMMKTPVVIVTVALTIAILLAASFLIATGTRGESVLWPLGGHPAGQIQPPAGK